MQADKHSGEFMTETRAPVCFKMDAGILKRFREAVFRRYGRIYGAYQKELSNAVESRLRELEAPAEQTGDLEDDR